MREIISDAEFRKRIGAGNVGGYLFFGDEDYLKMHALKAARQAACPDPSMEVFNHIIVDASATERLADSLAGAVAALPMMADKKLVEAVGLAVCDLKAADIDAISAVAASLEEFDFNLLIISVPAGMIDEGFLPKRPSATLAKLCENLTPVHFSKVSTQKLMSWIVRHFEHNGVHAETGIPAAIVERCGSDMFTLSNEVDKLSYYVLSQNRNSVSLADVPFITAENNEFETFALSTAIAEGNSVRALDVLESMKAKKVDPIIIFSELAKTLSDMLGVKLLTSRHKSPAEIAAMLKFRSEYQVKAIANRVCNLPVDYLFAAVSACSAVDISLKRFSSGSGYVEIEKLICGLDDSRCLNRNAGDNRLFSELGV